MKKFFFTLLVLVGFGQMSNAQLLTTGLKAGASLGAAQVNEAISSWESDGFNAGVHAGFFAKLSLGPLFLQPEAYYTFTQAHLQKGNTSVGGSEELQLDFHRLDVPLMAGFYLGPGFRINAGPFASLLINANGQSNIRPNADELVKESYERALWGWQAGIGFDFWRLTLDARYETTQGNLRDYDPENTPVADYLPREQSQQQVVVSLGYKF
jgi:opacity protein-like surface antigen